MINRIMTGRYLDGDFPETEEWVKSDARVVNFCLKAKPKQPSQYACDPGSGRVKLLRTKGYRVDFVQTGSAPHTLIFL